MQTYLSWDNPRPADEVVYSGGQNALRLNSKCNEVCKMEYLIGLFLSLAVAGLAIFIGLDREHAFYPTVLIVIAAYYVLFAVMGGSTRVLVIEIVVASGFLLVAILGYKKNLWLLAVALAGHGVFDIVHPLLFENPGVPRWWPGFCLVFDVILAGLLAMDLIKRRIASYGLET